MSNKYCKIKNLRNDPELKKLIEIGKPLPRDRVIFSTYYIATHENGDPNPIGSLFIRFRDDFETQIISNKKKRIFDTNEKIRLQPLTIKKIVELIEHHDLIKIDEDLNGRLFQTFLSATMRGKELGQFFTPRTVVEFMTDLAEIRVRRDPPYAPNVIDLSCGTGGFLIEAMAKMINQFTTGSLSKVLSTTEKSKIMNIIKDKNIFGIDAGKDPPIARIARINMYLHGDGGSRIWFADALDKKNVVEETLDPDLRVEREELRKIFLNNEVRFHIGLTNPPFSMKRTSKEADQHILLQDYKCREYIDKKGKKKLKTSLKSNVMFLERYHDLLDNGGILLTVIDESVLNTDTDRPFRDWVLKNYYVKAIISLPQDAFIEAGSNVKTSILLLEKKPEQSEDQPHTFYARSENIGYDGIKQDESKNDLPKIRNAYLEFKKSGEVYQPRESQRRFDKSTVFTKILAYGTRRIDFEWLDPRHDRMDKLLEDISKTKGYKLETISDLISRNICQIINGKTAEIYVSQGIPIIKVRNVTNEGIIWDDIDYVIRDFFEPNKRSHLKKNDVLITSTGLGTIGRIAVMDKDDECMTDGHVTTIRILDTSKISPDYLTHYLRSVFGQMQMERYTVGSTGQTELNDPDIALIKILYPENISEQNRILKPVLSYEVEALKSRDNYKTYLDRAKDKFMKILEI